MAKNGMKYDAFISYSQESEKPLARALQQALRRLGAKRYFLKFRSLEVFRDETDSSGIIGLKEKIENGLRESEYLILLASPPIAREPKESDINWIEEEIRFWLQHKQGSSAKDQAENSLKIVICIAEGEIKWDYNLNDFDWETTSCLPKILSKKFSSTPLWVDFRETKQKAKTNPNIFSLEFPDFKQKVAEVSSQIQSITVDELISKDRQVKRIVSLTVGLSVIALIALTILSIFFGTSANSQSKISKERLVQMNRSNGLGLFTTGDYYGSLLWFIKSLSLGGNEVNKKVDLIRIQSVINFCPNLIKLISYTSEISSSAVDGNGKLLAVGFKNGNILIHDLIHDQLILKSVKAHEDNVNYLEFSPDGNMLLSCGLDSSAKLIELATGKSFSLSNGRIFRAHFSDNSKQIITSLYDTLAIWNSETGKRIKSIKTDQGQIEHAMFSPDGGLLVSAGDNRTLKIWNAQTGIEMAIVSGEKNDDGYMVSSGFGSQIDPRDAYVNDLKFSLDGKHLIVAYFRHANIFSIDSLKFNSIRLKHSDNIITVNFNAKKTRAVTTGMDKVAKIWNARKGTQLCELRHNDWVNFAYFFDDDTKLITATRNGEIHFWDSQSGSEIYSPIKTNNRILNVEYQQLTEKLILTTENGVSQVWEISDPLSPICALDHDDWLNVAAFNSEHNTLITGGNNNQAKVWDIPSGTLILPPIHHDQFVFTASFNKDGSRFLTINKNEIWLRKRSGDIVKSIVFPTNESHPSISASFSPDGKFVGVRCGDTIMLYSALNGEPFFGPLKGNFTFSPNMEYVMIHHYSLDGEKTTMEIIGLNDNYKKELKIDGLFGSLCISTDGEFLSNQLGDTLSIFKLSTGKCIQKISGLSIKNFIDNDRILVGQKPELIGSVNLLRVWSLSQNRFVSPPMKIKDFAHKISINSDGSLLAVGDYNDHLSVWDLADGQPCVPGLELKTKIVTLSFKGNDELYIVCQDKKIRILNLKASDFSLESLNDFAKVHSGYEIDSANFALALLNKDQLVKSFNGLVNYQPSNRHYSHTTY